MIYKKHRCSAFTLVEILVVITIIGTLASLFVAATSKKSHSQISKEAAYTQQNGIPHHMSPLELRWKEEAKGYALANLSTIEYENHKFIILCDVKHPQEWMSFIHHPDCDCQTESDSSPEIDY